MLRKLKANNTIKASTPDAVIKVAKNNGGKVEWDNGNERLSGIIKVKQGLVNQVLDELLDLDIKASISSQTIVTFSLR